MSEHRTRGVGRKSEAGVRFFDPLPTDHGVARALAALGAGQNGVFTVAQARSATGLTPRALQLRVARGALHRIHRGVLSLVPRELLTSHGHRMAAVLACGAGAVLSHHDAADLHRLLDASRRARYEITVPTHSGRIRRRNMTIHRSATLRPCDVAMVHGIPATTVARTIFDLAERESISRLKRVLAEADYLEVLDVPALEEQIRHNPHRGTAPRKLTRALAVYRPGTSRTDGPIGDRMLEVLRAAGVPEPRTQLWIDLHDGEPMIRADFAWPDAMVILETDGEDAHAPEMRRRRDIRRDQRAARAGWHTVRVSWDQISDEPGRLGATMLELVTTRSGPEADAA